MARALLSAGAQADQQSYKGISPLWIASNRGHVEVVRTLLSAGAQVDLQEKQGYSPLLAACNCGRVAVIPVLVAAGARLDLRAKNGMTPLDTVPPSLRPQVLRQLLPLMLIHYSRWTQCHRPCAPRCCACCLLCWPATASATASATAPGAAPCAQGCWPAAASATAPGAAPCAQGCWPATASAIASGAAPGAAGQGGGEGEQGEEGEGGELLEQANSHRPGQCGGGGMLIRLNPQRGSPIPLARQAAHSRAAHSQAAHSQAAHSQAWRHGCRRAAHRHRSQAAHRSCSRPAANAPLLLRVRCLQRWSPPPPATPAAGCSADDGVISSAGGGCSADGSVLSSVGGREAPPSGGSTGSFGRAPGGGGGAAARVCAMCGGLPPTPHSPAGAPKLKACGRCMSARYCSLECQRAHWSRGGHKEACPHLREARERRKGGEGEQAGGGGDDT